MILITALCLDNDMAAQAILHYRNTPIQCIGLSPAQLLLHRRLQDFIPSHPHLYKPHPEWIAAAPKCEKTLSKHNADLIKRYNCTAHALSPLHKGDTVSIPSELKSNEIFPHRFVSFLQHHVEYWCYGELGNHHRNSLNEELYHRSPD